MDFKVTLTYLTILSGHSSLDIFEICYSFENIAKLKKKVCDFTEDHHGSFPGSW